MSQMTPRERFWRVVNHEEADRVPNFFGGTNSSIVPSHYKAVCDELGIVDSRIPVGDFGTVNLHRDIKERFHSDVELLLLGSPHRKTIASAEGDLVQDGMWGFMMKEVGGYRTFPDNITPLRQAKSVKDIDEYSMWPNPDDPVYYNKQKERALKFFDSGKVVLGEGSYATAPFFVYPWLRGVDQWMMDPYKNPDLYQHLCQKIVDYSKVIMERWLADVGPYLDVLCFYNDIAMQNGPMVSLNHYRKWVLPYEKQLTDVARKMTKAKFSTHCCGSCFDLIPGFIECGYEILNPVQTRAKNMEPWRLKKTYGDRITFYGGLDIQRLLPFGTPEEVRAGVKQLIKELATGGGFLFSTSHNIEPDSSPSNILTMFDAAYEFGEYPLQMD